MSQGSPAAEALTRALCDAWFEVCELPTRWPTTSMDQRETFRAMTDAALAAGRAGQKTDVEIARALCHGFWRGAPAPRTWTGQGQSERDAFRRVAQAFLAAARELRSQRQAQAQPQEQAA